VTEAEAALLRQNLVERKRTRKTRTRLWWSEAAAVGCEWAAGPRWKSLDAASAAVGAEMEMDI
jgi:hypothetical protein